LQLTVSAPRDDRVRLSGAAVLGAREPAGTWSVAFFGVISPRDGPPDSSEHLNTTRMRCELGYSEPVEYDEALRRTLGAFHRIAL
jgi:hypothetical protein